MKISADAAKESTREDAFAIELEKEMSVQDIDLYTSSIENKNSELMWCPAVDLSEKDGPSNKFDALATAIIPNLSGSEKTKSKFLIPIKLNNGRIVGVQATVTQDQNVILSYYHSSEKDSVIPEDIQKGISSIFRSTDINGIGTEVLPKENKILQHTEITNSGPITLFNLENAANGVNPTTLPQVADIYMKYHISLESIKEQKLKREIAETLEIISSKDFTKNIAYKKTANKEQFLEEKIARIETIKRSLREQKTQEKPLAYKGLGADCTFIEGQGFKVNKVIPGSVADKMKLKPGQMITHLGDTDLKEFKEDNMMEAVNLLRNAGTETNGNFNLKVLEGDKEKKLTGNREKGNDLIVEGNSAPSKNIEEKLTQISATLAKLKTDISIEEKEEEQEIKSNVLSRIVSGLKVMVARRRDSEESGRSSATSNPSEISEAEKKHNIISRMASGLKGMFTRGEKSEETERTSETFRSSSMETKSSRSSSMYERESEDKSNSTEDPQKKPSHFKNLLNYAKKKLVGESKTPTAIAEPIELEMTSLKKSEPQRETFSEPQETSFSRNSTRESVESRYSIQSSTRASEFGYEDVFRNSSDIKVEANVRNVEDNITTVNPMRQSKKLHKSIDNTTLERISDTSVSTTSSAHHNEEENRETSFSRRDSLISASNSESQHESQPEKQQSQNFRSSFASTTRDAASKTFSALSGFVGKATQAMSEFTDKFGGVDERESFQSERSSTKEVSLRNSRSSSQNQTNSNELDLERAQSFSAPSIRTSRNSLGDRNNINPIRSSVNIRKRTLSKSGKTI